MDPLEELSRMAALTIAQDSDTTEEQIQRWQTLFSYSREEAIVKLNERDLDLDRKTISNEIWSEISEQWIAKGYDKSAYEHHLERQMTLPKPPIPNPTSTTTPTSTAQTYLVKLSGSTPTAADVQRLLGLEHPPETERDDADPTVHFCRLSLTERQLLESKVFPKPTFISLGSPPSAKRLHAYSKHPTLGMEATLPQHRADSPSTEFRPSQNEYPVWYFFYGNLAKPRILGPRINMEEDDILLMPARIRYGRLSSWRGKYRALLDGNREDVVQGSAFLVVSQEVEDWLRAYETCAYEVVRCCIEMEDGREMDGCCFRFCGQADA